MDLLIKTGKIKDETELSHVKFFTTTQMLDLAWESTSIAHPDEDHSIITLNNISIGTFGYTMQKAQSWFYAHKLSVFTFPIFVKAIFITIPNDKQTTAPDFFDIAFRDNEKCINMLDINKHISFEWEKNIQSTPHA